MSRLVASLLLAFAATASALTAEDAVLLKKEYQQYQAWSLSRNYFFGTTLKPDRVKALAWQLIYVAQLPASYPEKEKLLGPFKQPLANGQIRQATELAQSFRQKYALLAPFTEAELYKVYELHEQKVSWNELQFKTAPDVIRSNFNKWLDWIASEGYEETAKSLEQMKMRLVTEGRFPIVYGQIIVKGPEPLQMIKSEVHILPGGFFIGQVQGRNLSFNLAGYQTALIALDSHKKLQNIPPVIFSMPPGLKQTGVIGRVLPWAGIERANMLLRQDSGNKSTVDPWYQPAIPLTVTNGGEFYTTALSAGRYILFISTAGLSTFKQFSVRDGEVRGLSLVDLRGR